MSFPLKKEKLHIFVDIFRTLRWALRELKSFRVRLYLYVIILVLQALYEIFIASRVGNIIDLALLDNMKELIKTASIFISMYAFNIVICIISNRFAAHNYNGMYNTLELKVYRKIMDSSWEELTEYHSGDLITRLASDIKTVAGNTSGLVPTMIAKLTMIICAGIYIIALDYSMILVAIIVAPIVLIASRLLMGKIYKSQIEIKEIESRINSYNKETFNNIQAVKAFNLGNSFYDKMVAFEDYRRSVDLRSNKYSIISWGISFFAGLLGAAICIGWMFYRVHLGAISFGALTILIFLAFQVGDAMKVLLNLIPTIMEYMASADRVKKILNLNDEDVISSGENIQSFADDAEKNGASIKIEDMFFKYRNGYEVFKGASLEANPGEIVALVGPSGEGKTTMLRIILGIVKAQKGMVLASNGISSLPLGKETRQLISYVPQGNTMMAGSILENMKLVNPDALDEDIIDALKTACIYEFIEQLPDKLHHMLGENGLGFSEGQNQRLSIARALLKKAPVILLDEATSALDVATERQVLNNIMKKDPKKTVILTTHRPTVLSMCDRVYRIADKRVNVIGDTDIKKLMDEF
ncbi:ABC transporter ATP-binding protein [Butyrivibrio sp. AC2005]|uniref:ABC transporter ATP-binding protein n=1 Tax=Butyrivibrio sp. AC2005 TaxID=1280672 RepID=UPI000417767D|nr:ABC transporter ATP-binding protein [Butyrivibrio sp. AC2005]